jgi:predicted nucleic acid-binding protein
MHNKIIVDTSVLIALEKLNLLTLLCKVYDEIIIPEGVKKEYGELNLPCLKIQKPERNLVHLLTKDLNLGIGEAEVISLSKESTVNALIDDKQARKIAKNLGLKISGTIGFLLKAEKLGVITEAYPYVEELKKSGFFISDNLLEQIKNMDNNKKQ